MGGNWNSHTTLYGHPLKTDTSSLRTVFFVPRERKPLHLRTLSMTPSVSVLTLSDCTVLRTTMTTLSRGCKPRIELLRFSDVSFDGETSGGAAKCRLFSQATGHISKKGGCLFHIRWSVGHGLLYLLSVHWGERGAWRGLTQSVKHESNLTYALLRFNLLII